MYNLFRFHYYVDRKHFFTTQKKRPNQNQKRKILLYDTKKKNQLKRTNGLSTEEDIMRTIINREDRKKNTK